MMIFTNRRQLLSNLNPCLLKKVVSHARLGNVDMHMYAKCDKKITCGSRVQFSSFIESIQYL